MKIFNRPIAVIVSAVFFAAVLSGCGSGIGSPAAIQVVHASGPTVLSGTYAVNGTAYQNMDSWAGQLTFVPSTSTTGALSKVTGTIYETLFEQNVVCAEAVQGLYTQNGVTGLVAGGLELATSQIPNIPFGPTTGNECGSGLFGVTDSAAISFSISVGLSGEAILFSFPGGSGQGVPQ